MIKNFFCMIRAIIASPLLLPYAVSSQKTLIRADVAEWVKNFKWQCGSGAGTLLKLLAGQREFRNVYFFRIRKGNMPGKLALAILSIIYRQSPFLLLEPSTEIGPGLFIQHGLSTVINADSIGKNCWINQQVTVGYKDETSGRPKIGDNVQIAAGAKVIGGVKVGSNVKIGANAVVVKDVPDNCTVIGIPARIVRRDGKRVDESL